MLLYQRYRSTSCPVECDTLRGGSRTCLEVSMLSPVGAVRQGRPPYEIERKMISSRKGRIFAFRTDGK